MKFRRTEEYKKKASKKMSRLAAEKIWGTKENPIDTQLKTYGLITHNKIPTGLLTRIGNSLGVSRERVRQRAKALGFLSSRETAKKRHVKKCEYCRKEFYAKYLSRVVCSRECYLARHLEKYGKFFSCEVCGLRKRYYVPEYKKPRFCSKSCQGKWFGYHTRKDARYPADRASFNKKLRDLDIVNFTSRTFLNIFGYISHSGALVAIHSLERKGWIKKLNMDEIQKYPLVWQIVEEDHE